MDTIAGRLIKLRRFRLKMTQKELAKLLDVNVQYVSNIERGLTPIPKRRIVTLSSVLKLNKLRIINAMVTDYKNDLIQITGDGAQR